MSLEQLNLAPVVSFCGLEMRRCEECSGNCKSMVAALPGKGVRVGMFVCVCLVGNYV